MDQSAVISKNPDILCSDLGGKMLMMNMTSGNYHQIDEIGSKVWNELEQPVAISDLCDTLSARYSVGRAQCLDDLLGFLQEMADLDLITVAPADGS